MSRFFDLPTELPPLVAYLPYK